MANTPIRHPSLSSKIARDALDHVSGSIYDGVFAAIDNLAALYDGLEAVRTHSDPMQTKEANAIAYKKKFDAAQEQKETLLRRHVANIAEYQSKIVADAHAKAGINLRPPQSADIWQALRGMSQKERDGAVLDAIKRGDRVVISAIKHSPSPLLTGTFTVPVDTSIELFLDEHTPEMKEELENIHTALTFLNNAAGAFRATTEKMRDLAAEDRAEAGNAAAKRAEAELQAAMQGRTPATS